MAVAASRRNKHTRKTPRSVEPGRLGRRGLALAAERSDEGLSTFLVGDVADRIADDPRDVPIVDAFGPAAARSLRGTLTVRRFGAEKESNATPTRLDDGRGRRSWLRRLGSEPRQH
jgi:hypothetical protein